MWGGVDDGGGRLAWPSTKNDEFWSCRIGCRCFRVTGPIPIAGTFPHVADHVGETIAIRRKAPHRSRFGIAIIVGVQHRKDTLPGIRNGFAFRIESAAPVVFAVTSAPRCELPLRFRWQAAAEPIRISKGVVVSDVDHGVIFLAVDRAPGTAGLAPVCTG